jgi:hypothetical protein
MNEVKNGKIAQENLAEPERKKMLNESWGTEASILSANLEFVFQREKQ